MSGAGRRTIHKETGSGGWPNGLTVDYLEKRILWIDARWDQGTAPQLPSPLGPSPRSSFPIAPVLCCHLTAGLGAEGFALWGLFVSAARPSLCSGFCPLRGLSSLV